MDKKKKTLLITAGIAAVLLAAALFLSRPQPLGERDPCARQLCFHLVPRKWPRP